MARKPLAKGADDDYNVSNYLLSWMATMGKGTKKNERLSGEERRKQIINTALTLFAERGFSGTRTREIAELANVSETLIFQHFKTKEDLYRAALTELFSQYPVLPEVEDKMAEKDDVGVFKAFALHVIKHGRQDRRIVRLGIFSAMEGPRFGEIFHQGGDAGPLPQLLSPYIQQRIEDGAFRTVNAQIAAQLFIETANMYLADQEASISGPPLPFPYEEVVETLVGIFLDGLKAKGRPSGR
jgi:TetR/AcrR family transcriptional regulator